MAQILFSMLSNLVMIASEEVQGYIGGLAEECIIRTDCLAQGTVLS